MTDSLPFIAVGLHLLWVAAAFFAVVSWRRLRAVDDTPTMPMAAVRPGMEARIPGRLAFHGAARTSPLGAEPAVWFDWKVERHGDAHRDPVLGGSAITQAVGSSIEPFALVDDAGNRMLVWPKAAEVQGAPEQTWDGEYPETIDGTQRDSLVQGIKLAAPLTDASVLHFTERWLPPGAPCLVVGRVEAPRPEHGPEILGQVREGVFISAGAPADRLASLRKQTTSAAILALAAFILAVLVSVLA